MLGFDTTTPGFGMESSSCLGLGYTHRLAGFAMFLGFGLVCLAMCSVQVFQLVTGNSHKFALMYTLANVLLTCSTMFLVGPRRQLALMFKEHRAQASAAYLTSMALIIYICMWHATVVLVLPLLAVQLASLLWYVLTYLPWGSSLLGYLPYSS